MWHARIVQNLLFRIKTRVQSVREKLFFGEFAFIAFAW